MHAVEGRKLFLYEIERVVRWGPLILLLSESLGTEEVVVCELQRWLCSWSREDLHDFQKSIGIQLTTRRLSFWASDTFALDRPSIYHMILMDISLPWFSASTVSLYAMRDSSALIDIYNCASGQDFESLTCYDADRAACRLYGHAQAGLLIKLWRLQAPCIFSCGTARWW